MKRILSIVIFIKTASFLAAQTTTEYTQLLSRYEQWKAAQYKTGKYATPGNCKNGHCDQ